MSDIDSIVRNRLLETLRGGGMAITMSVRVVTSIEIIQMIKTSGFDGFYVDLEHSALDMYQAGQICTAALGAGLPAFVRVPSNTAEHIARALDAGALGVHVPHVDTAEDAQRAVAAARFPPLGSRSVSPTLPQLQYLALPMEPARARLNQCTAVIAIIESQRGLENIGEIAAVPGIDVLLIGTNDLCADWNLHGQFDHPRVEEAYRLAMSACLAHGKHLGVGGLAGRPDLLQKYMRLGARYVMAGSDLQFFMKEAQGRVNNIRALY